MATSSVAGRAIGPRVTINHSQCAKTTAKVSHQKVYVGDRWTTVKHGEISKPLLVAMLKQLNIPRDDF
jgi:hypothetical protein